MVSSCARRACYKVATEIERQGFPGYGKYHQQSHGEAFLHLVTDRLRGDGLYLFDEPEAALSPQRQLVFLAAMHSLIEREAQFVIATHSPIIMAYPEATIYEFSSAGIREVAYRDTEHFRVTRAFLSRTGRCSKNSSRKKGSPMTEEIEIRRPNHELFHPWPVFGFEIRISDFLFRPAAALILAAGVLQDAAFFPREAVLAFPVDLLQDAVDVFVGDRAGRAHPRA